MYTSVRLCDKLHGQRLVSWLRSWLRDVENLKKKERKRREGEREREKRSFVKHDPRFVLERGFQLINER